MKMEIYLVWVENDKNDVIYEFPIKAYSYFDAIAKFEDLGIIMSNTDKITIKKTDLNFR